MKWYPYLYVGEGASKKKNKIIRKLKIGAGMIDVWVITEAANRKVFAGEWLSAKQYNRILCNGGRGMGCDRF